MLYYFGKFLFWLTFRFFGRLTVVGAEHIPPAGGLMVVANHTSFADPPLIGVTLARPIWFMAKSELFAVPLLGGLIRRTHAFPVKRGAVDRQALQTAHKLLGAGKALLIFIEGGRSPDGMLQPPTLGPAMIALRAGVPVVPAAIINADHLLPRDSHGFHFSHVQVVYGEPVSFSHLAGKHADRAALNEVSTTLMRSIADLLRAHGGGDRVPQGYLEETTESDNPTEMTDNPAE